MYAFNYLRIVPPIILCRFVSAKLSLYGGFSVLSHAYREFTAMYIILPVIYHNFVVASLNRLKPF